MYASEHRAVRMPIPARAGILAPRVLTIRAVPSFEGSETADEAATPGGVS